MQNTPKVKAGNLVEFRSAADHPDGLILCEVRRVDPTSGEVTLVAISDHSTFEVDPESVLKFGGVFRLVG